MFSTKILNNSITVPSQAQLAQLQQQLGQLLARGGELVIDSRKVTPGAIFCAYPGTGVDGRDFIAAALRQGAVAILWEPGIEFTYAVENYPIAGLMHYVGILAALQAGYPSNNFYSFAITGTNGKTSISHWLNQAYSFLGMKTAIIGTTGAGVYPDISDYAATTPDPITLQHLLLEFKQQQVKILAMEVSSHALSQGRVNGVSFNSAIFTNLTLDHLDYHQTMANYFAAKEHLFYWHGLEQAIINSDDSYGYQLIQHLEARTIAVLSYGINSGELRASELTLTKHGISFVLSYHGQRQWLQAQLIGRFNVYNLLALIGGLISHGVPWAQLAAIVAALKPVTGRMDAILRPNQPLVVVDYAHTPDALEQALSTLGELKAAGRLICVFGCGGNRDRSKRPLMGQIAAKLSDVVIVTSDNPRDEDPEAIIDQITQDLSPGVFLRISERKAAISAAIALALPADIVLIAGKGHENYQEIKGVKHPFSDLELVAFSLSLRAQ